MKTKAVWRVTALVLGLTYSSIAATPPNGQAGVLAGATPKDVIEHYERAAPQTAEDYFTLALAHFSNLSFQEALESANRALPLFKEPQKQALCYQLIAQSYGALGDYRLAAKAATEGVQAQPSSQELAALRVAYYKELGDELNFRVADEYLKQLNAVYKKDPKCEPITAGLIIAGIVCLTGVVIKMLDSVDKAQDPAVRERILAMLETVVGKAAELVMIVCLSGNALDHAAVKEAK